MLQAKAVLKVMRKCTALELKKTKMKSRIIYWPALPEGLTPENRTHVAELRFASFIAQTGINFTQSKAVLEFFKTVSLDRAVFQRMRISCTKISNIVNNVLSPYEKERHVKSSQNCKFPLNIHKLTEHACKNVIPKWFNEFFTAGFFRKYVPFFVPPKTSSFLFCLVVYITSLFHYLDFFILFNFSKFFIYIFLAI